MQGSSITGVLVSVLRIRSFFLHALLMPSMHLARIRKWILQSPPAEWAILQLRQLLVGALRQGPIPKHVAFVMDGNRRFARNHCIETVEGHNLGFEALARVWLPLTNVQMSLDRDASLTSPIYLGP